MIGDIIVTTIKLDLTGFQVQGSDAGDVIGVGTNPAYIYKNVPTENGILFRQRITCIEVGTAASGTIETDINLAWNASANIDFDEAGGTGSEINAGVLAITDSAETNGTPITTSHYAYLTEGATNASNGVYASGQYLITLWGVKAPVAI